MRFFLQSFITATREEHALLFFLLGLPPPNPTLGNPTVGNVVWYGGGVEIESVVALECLDNCDLFFFFRTGPFATGKGDVTSS